MFYITLPSSLGKTELAPTKKQQQPTIHFHVLYH